MKLNNKGITLVEIIISVSLISIVLVFLFNMLIQVNNENSDNEIKSSYLVNQSTFIKQIEEDFLDYDLILGEECNYSNIKKASGTTTNTYLYLSNLFGTSASSSNIKCLKFTLTNEYTYAYLFLYKRDIPSTSDITDYKTILSYYRGDFKQSVELEEFDWTINASESVYRKVNSSGFDKYQMYSLPIIGPDGNDYSINLSYIG